MSSTRVHPVVAVLGVFAGVVVAGAIVEAISSPRPARRRQPPAPSPGLGAFLGQLGRGAQLMGVPVPEVVETDDADAEVRHDLRIYVRPGFIVELVERYCDSHVCRLAVVLGIAAHELFHVVARHPCEVDHGVAHRHDLELAADHAAGWVLARAGVPPGDLARVIGDLSRYPTLSHPGEAERRAAIWSGYRSGRREHQSSASPMV